MTHLARTLRVTDYFALGWGTMVGVGWLVVMDDWLLRGGSLGAAFGFAIGGILLLPIGYVYSKLVVAIPDAAGEVAYTARVFPKGVSFATGWMMLLSYFIVCPWEAVAAGRIAGYIFPVLDTHELYRVAGYPVYLPHVVIGVAFTGLITLLNYRGIRTSSRFQNWMTFGTLALFVVFVAAGVLRGAPSNFPPLFTHTPFVSILLVIQIVPYFMTGFESVTKTVEEASVDFRAGGFLIAILMAIVIGTLFYTIVIFAVSYVAPWRMLTGERFMTAIAFEGAVGSRWIVSVILATALLSLLKVFNGNFVGASHLLFAMGRRRIVDPRLGEVHPTNQTPARAVLCIGLGTAAFMFLGSSILVPISEVGGFASACGWTAACAAYLALGPRAIEQGIAMLGIAVGGIMLLMKILPVVPGHFSKHEWIAFGGWVVLGALIAASRRGMTSTLRSEESFKT